MIGLWWHRWTLAIAAGLSMGLAGAAHAGPPFVTDDPEPVDLGHWEVYGFSAGTHVQGDSSGVLAGAEVNYGAAPNLQLHIIVPLAYDAPKGGGTQVGLGDVELGVKYRFITPGEKDWFPQVGIFPLVELATGNADRGLGDGKTRVFLPVWLQKDFGDWTTYGGGGYWINPGPGKKDYWFAGWLLQKQVTKQLALGAELFHQTAMDQGGHDSAGFNVGGVYDFTEHYHLLFSAGRGLQDVRDSNEFSYYLALQKTF
jgi:hypothetical protein